MQQTLFRQSAHEWIDEAQHAAEKLLMKMEVITIEDVLSVCPRPSYLHPNVTGGVFQNSIFKHQGFAVSKRSISNGRIIRVWTLQEEFYPTYKLNRRFRNLKDFEND